MSYILHLGHQPNDIAGISGLLSTAAGGFDPTLDINAIRHTGSSTYSAPFSLSVAEPAGDLWLGFRYMPPNGDANSINRTEASFLEVYSATNVLLAQIKPITTTNRYHAIAAGDTSVQGSSSYTAPNGQPQWIDVRVAVGAAITIELYVEGVLQTVATAANTSGKGKPRHVVFANTALHGSTSSRTWSYAHIAALDGVSTIGRRFVRRSPNAIASFNQMVGSIDALRDGDIATRVASTAAGQRMSFSLTGPTGPASVSAIAGVHLKQIAQGGTDGPDAIAGFLRIGGVNHDATPETVPDLAPKPVYSSWAVNPVDASPWDASTLPTEVGIVSA
jgi:hypothetical protein